MAGLSTFYWPMVGQYDVIFYRHYIQLLKTARTKKHCFPAQVFTLFCDCFSINLLWTKLNYNDLHYNNFSWYSYILFLLKYYKNSNGTNRCENNVFQQMIIFLVADNQRRKYIVLNENYGFYYFNTL